MDTSEKNRKIAQTINSQIGNKAFYLLGALNKAYGVNEENQTYLSFKIRGSKKVSHIRITYLEGIDLYKTEFLKCRKDTIKTVSEFSEIYCDQLREIIEKETGLYTSL